MKLSRATSVLVLTIIMCVEQERSPCESYERLILLTFLSNDFQMYGKKTLLDTQNTLRQAKPYKTHTSKLFPLARTSPP